MTTKVLKIGNSLGVHIPKEVARKAGISRGTPVSVDYSAGKILIIPDKRETLEDLLKNITPENNQAISTDFGADVGKEIID